MRLKPVPPAPEDLEGLFAARDAVPLVPKPENDCCGRLMDRRGVPSRDEARTWLTFLRALDLVAEAEAGYHRTDDEPDREELAARFKDGVFAAREVLSALGEQPRDADAVFEAVRDVVPEWEKHKDPAWERTWRERVGRLLKWAVLLGLVEKRRNGFVPA